MMSLYFIVHRSLATPFCRAPFSQAEERHVWSSYLLLVLITGIITTLLGFGGSGLLSPDAARATSTKGRSESEINVLLRVETDDERRNVDDLLADADVALLDEDTSVVDGLGETELVDTSLEAALQEILELQGQHVIESHAGLVEHTDTHETANEGISFEETLGVLFVESEKLTMGQSV